ncbi:MAG: hypothetical protein ABEJ44_00310 [Halanaeroarchaeum sp.]
MVERDVAELVPGEYFQQALVAGEINEVVHAERAADPGDTFTVEGVSFEVSEVEETPVEEAVPADAREDYDAGGDGQVYVIHLERVDEG